MRLLSLLSIVALPAAVLAADYQTVLADINAISDHLDTLSASVDSVTTGIPGLPYALQVQVEATNLDKRIQTGAQNANASPAFGIGSLQVGLALIGLQPQITDALAQISEKNTVFGDLGIIVLASLTQLKRDTTAFSDEIVPKLGPLEAAIAPAVIESIENAFDEAIAAYESNGKLLYPHRKIFPLILTDRTAI
ncbi:hydrophobic surface binding protein A-domain-containing protein [Aspergillus granulosus]|uniref:Hydrophobic surface binding protein A-domain-containing protein n=1 Tax=Aspergillus granulosus TaxID=176169 RepID=A0ABR4H0D2_9EURO